MQPENQRPDLRTSLMNMSLVLRLPRLPSFLGMFGMLQNPQVLRAFLAGCTIPGACHAKRHLSV